MSDRLHVLLIVISVLFFFYIVQNIRKSKVKLDYVFFWIIFSLFLIIVSIFPSLVTKIKTLLGISSDVNFLFMFIIFLVSFKSFTLSLQLSRLQEKFEALVQNIALDDYEKKRKDKV